MAVLNIRADALESQLQSTTKESAKEIAKLRMKLFEFEMNDLAANSQLSEKDENSLLHAALAMHSHTGRDIDGPTTPRANVQSESSSTSMLPSIPANRRSPADLDVSRLRHRRNSKKDLVD